MNIYVGNLAREVTEEELKQEFTAFGEVTSVSIIKDKRNVLDCGSKVFINFIYSHLKSSSPVCFRVPSVPCPTTTLANSYHPFLKPDTFAGGAMLLP